MFTYQYVLFAEVIINTTKQSFGTKKSIALFADDDVVHDKAIDNSYDNKTHPRKNISNDFIDRGKHLRIQLCLLGETLPDQLIRVHKAEAICDDDGDDSANYGDDNDSIASEYTIASINDHTGNILSNDKIALDQCNVRVHWKGYPHEEDTWESYSDIKKTAAFGVYIKAMRRSK
jgi:Chromo (CHRromatin Organisation MOdifier) domain